MAAETPRTILHCDCNNFYASVELLEHPELKDKPVAVAGDPEGRHGVILAKNYIAKRLGVQTAETIWQARKKCPDLILLPPHHDKYEAMSRRVNAIYLNYTDQVEAFSVDESWLDVTGSRALFGDGAEIADTLRRRVREELGITISVGVSDNRAWAKMGSDYKKPDATTVIDRESAPEILFPQPVGNLLFVGRASQEQLRRHGILTIGALAACDKALLIRLLGKQGETLWRMANGIDQSPIRRWGDREKIKSIGRGWTFPCDLQDKDAWRAGLSPLCEDVGARLRAHSLRCRTVTLQIRDPGFVTISRQRTLKVPTALTRTIYKEACGILDDCWPEHAPIRMMTVTLSGLISSDEPVAAQISMLDAPEPDDPRQLRLEHAIDRLRDRYGKNTVLQARAQNTNRDSGITKSADRAKELPNDTHPSL